MKAAIICCVLLASATQPIDRQTKISSEDQIADLRTQVDRLTSRLDRDWVRAAKLVQLTNDQSTQAPNGWPARTIDSAPLPSNIETPSEPIVAIAQTTERAIIKKKSHRSNRRNARVIPTRTQAAPTVAGVNHAYAEPVQAGQQLTQGIRSFRR